MVSDARATPGTALRRPDPPLPHSLVARFSKFRPALLVLAWYGVFLAALPLLVASAIPFSTGPFALESAAALSLLFVTTLMLLPAVHLFRYAAAIRAVARQPSSATFERVIRRQLRLWRVVAIFALVAVLIIIAGGIALTEVVAG